mgnify:CR=1 FL=1
MAAQEAGPVYNHEVHHGLVGHLGVAEEGAEEIGGKAGKGGRIGFIVMIGPSGAHFKDRIPDWIGRLIFPGAHHAIDGGPAAHGAGLGDDRFEAWDEV